MKKELSVKARKVIFYIIVAVSFLAIYIYNFMTPLMSDELQFNPAEYTSVIDIFRAEYQNYLSWNGRSVVQLIMRCFLLGPKWFFNICNSLCFVFLMFLIYWNIDGRKKYDFVLYGFANILVWLFGVSFGQTVLWESGACNYLWGSMIIMSMVTLYRHHIAHSEEVKHPISLAIGLFVLGILAGWCNENTSGGGILILLFTAGFYYFKNKKMNCWMISGIVGMALGFCLMFFAPGNKIRGELMKEEESHSGIMAYVGRFLKINDAVYTYFFWMLIITVFILTFMILKGKTLEHIYTAVIFTASCLATSYALIFTPTPMDRAYFGAGIFMTVACVQACAYITKEDIYFSTIKYAGILSLTILMYFLYMENGADLMRIMREVKERDTYVEEQKAQGNFDLIVPMIREEFQSEYTFIYSNDVDEDPESWGCSIYKTYYGLNSLVGVPRDEWTEY